MQFSPEDLAYFFEYKEGELFWLVSTSNRVKVGSRVGSDDGQGYVQTTLLGKKFRVHQLVWIMHNGPIPAGMDIDHIDQNKSNNRIENLRLVTRAGNMLNVVAHKDSLTGILGVSFVPSTAKWRATFQKKNLGHFNTPEEAEAAYSKAKASQMELLGL